MFGASFSSGLGSSIVDTISLSGVAQYSAGLSQLSRSHADFQQQSQKSSGVGSLGAGLTLGVTAPLMGLIGKGGQIGMAAFESESMVKASFGNMTADITRWSDTSAKSLGLNAFEMRRQAATLKQLFTGVGFDDRQSLKMSKSLVELKDDMESFYNSTDPMEASRALQSGLSGEVEPLRRYGVFLNEATVKAYAYKKGIASANSELNEQQKVQARFAYIQDTMKRNNVVGDLARTKDSPANQLRRTQAELQADLTKFGMTLMPLFQDVLGIAREFLPPIRTAVDKFSQLPESAKRFGIYTLAATGPLLMVADKIPGIIAGFNGIKKGKDLALDALGIGRKPELGGLSGSTSKTAVMHVKANIVYLSGASIGRKGGGNFDLDLDNNRRSGRRGRGRGRRNRGGGFDPTNLVESAVEAAATEAARRLAQSRATRTAAGRGAASLSGATKLLNWRHVFPAIREVFSPSTSRAAAFSFLERAKGAAQFVASGTMAQGVVNSATGLAGSSIRHSGAGRAIAGAVAGAKYSGLWDLSRRVAPWAGRAGAVVGGGLAGYDAAQDYKSIGMQNHEANAAGIGVGAGATVLGLMALIPAVVAALPVAALAAPALMAGGAGRYGFTLYSNRAQASAERGNGLSDADVKKAGSNKRAQSDAYFNRASYLEAQALEIDNNLFATVFQRERAKTLREEAETFRRSAQMRLKAAKQEEVAASKLPQYMSPDSEGRRWQNAQWEKQKADNAKNYAVNFHAATGKWPGQTTGGKVDQETEAVLSQYGFAVPGDLPAGQMQPRLTSALRGEGRAPIVNAIRRRDDASRITIALPPGNGDHMASEMKYSAIAPTSIGF